MSSVNDNVHLEEASPASEPLKSGQKTYTVGQLAYTRSGDKGDHCNIGKTHSETFNF